MKQTLIIFLILIQVAVALPCALDDAFFLRQPLSWQLRQRQIMADVENEDVKFAKDNYQWLYEKIMPADLRASAPDETFKSFRVHLKDSNEFFPDPDLIQKKNLNLFREAFELQGTIAYVGFFKKPYRMTVSEVKDTLTLEVRIHFQNPNALDLSNFSEKIKMAQKLWNDSRIKTDFKYQYKFTIVNEAQAAHFSVRILDETRGPYDTNWGRDWTGNVIAHEIGHMLGLGDEYKTLSGEFDCLKPSLMCSAWYGAHMLHHHYFVLRRLIKTN